mmetsp:Transcript_37351/g.74624  ORF Transcript_37351/g.74624 Transcript_37351/m.74624 type:complete len:202 (+) Transcript_37351:95-700(+)
MLRRCTATRTQIVSGRRGASHGATASSPCSSPLAGGAHGHQHEPARRGHSCEQRRAAVTTAGPLRRALNADQQWATALGRVGVADVPIEPGRHVRWLDEASCERELRLHVWEGLHPHIPVACHAQVGRAVGWAAASYSIRNGQGGGAARDGGTVVWVEPREPSNVAIAEALFRLNVGRKVGACVRLEVQSAGHTLRHGELG